MWGLSEVPPGRLSSAVVGNDDTLVPKRRWSELAAMGAVVGQCRVCNGNLKAIPPSEHDTQGEDGQITWYETRCDNCGRETAAPNGRILRRSSLHSEMPSGWLERRQQRDREEAKARQTGRPE